MMLNHMSDLTNLLPPERQSSLTRDYFIRLGVVAMIFVTILALVSLVLLVPTYVFLVGSSRVKTERLANIESTLVSSDGANLSARLAALSKSATTLSALAEAPTASVTIRSVLAVSRPGITLSGFVYTAAEPKTAGTLAITGTALTREALRSYQMALQGAAFAQAADLPVSAYAKDSNITFTITVTLAP